MNVITDIVWQTSILLLCTAALAAMLQRRAAADRYFVGLAGVCAVLLLPLKYSVLPDQSFPILVQSQPDTIVLTTPSMDPSINDSNIVDPSSGWSASTPAPANPSAGRRSLFLLITFWMLGVLVVATRSIAGIWGILKLLRNSQPVVNGAWLKLLKDLQCERSITSKVSLRIGENGISPMTWGILSHTILLPPAAEEWTEERLRLVITHELAHVQRRDAAKELPAYVACTLYWFNPLIWYAASRMRIERECACDDQVVTAGANVESYASHLIEIARGAVSARAAALSMIPTSRFENRIRTLLEAGTNRASTRFLKGLVGLALAVVVLISSTRLTAFPSAMSVILPAPASQAEPTHSIQPTKVPEASRPGRKQEAAPTQKFEEATIKPCDPDSVPAVPEGSRGGGMNSLRMTPGRTHVLCMTLGTLIRTAYGYGPANLDFITGGGIGPRGTLLQIGNSYGLGVEDGLRVKGGPNWVRSDRFSIEAVAAGEPDGPTMSGPMLRELLERRFQLKVHMDAVQVAAYSLVVAKGGLKIKPMPEDGCAPRPPATRGAPPPPAPADKPYCGANVNRNGQNDIVTVRGQELSALPALLGITLGGTRILDKTGVADKFSFVFEFAIDETATEAPPPAGPPVGEPPDIPFTSNVVHALEEQLGLSLTRDKVPRDLIVIDRVERPTPN